VAGRPGQARAAVAGIAHRAELSVIARDGVVHVRAGVGRFDARIIRAQVRVAAIARHAGAGAAGTDVADRAELAVIAGNRVVRVRAGIGVLVARIDGARVCGAAIARGTGDAVAGAARVSVRTEQPVVAETGIVVVSADPARLVAGVVRTDVRIGTVARHTAAGAPAAGIPRGAELQVIARNRVVRVQADIRGFAARVVGA